MDARAVGALERLGGTRNVLVIGARQRANGGVLDGVGNQLHGLKVTVGTGGKTSLDHIDLETLQLARDAQLFIARHGGAGRLFAVTQGGVKNNQFVGHCDVS